MKHSDAISAYTFWPDDDPSQGFNEVTVVRTNWGFGPYPDAPQWAIRSMGRTWSRSGEWEFEPQPSSRSREYLDRCRFSLDEALDQVSTALANHPFRPRPLA